MKDARAKVIAELRRIEYGYLLPLSLGIVAGNIVMMFFGVTLLAQGTTRNITHGDGFNLCYNVAAPAGQPALTIGSAQALAVDIKFDGGASANIVPTWVATGQADTFQVQIPESKFPVTAQAVGHHTYVLTVGGAVITLADGSTFAPGTTVSDFYDVVCKTCGPVIGPPNWLKIIGSTLAIVFGLFALFHH